ncbi:RND efflux system, outer membrane lipoprotein [Cupriavidus taiwanensis]|uniref:RND efflux system, outer membrane lipoprotein n=1 Tax=Cupriavidus taiwanensis TaxID=164546 RepID=A0A9Q7US22_9BURK|nr:efflux transporter outer membrane subunit [Cupriavidus taiwanensis]SPD63597.1 RND efflux system, outer membrane lipoprotein [Cupriavidus taiwanensis]
MNALTRFLSQALPVPLACALLLAGCAVGPDYQRSDAPMSAEFKEAAADTATPAWTGDWKPSWKPAEPQDALARPDWWTVFGDAQLDALMAEVQISNQNIKAAEAQYRQAVASLQAARAGFFPLVDAQAGASRARNATGNTLNGQSATLGATWELDVWGRVRRQVESSEASAQASEADLASTLLSTQATLAQSYFLLRVADAQKALLDRTVADYQKSLQLVQNQYAAGTAQRSDVLQSETQLKSAQAQQIDIQITRAQLEHAIAVLVGKPPAALSLAAGEFRAAPPRVPAAVPSQLLERRPDIGAAERRMASANAQIGVAQAAYYPTLSLSASGGLTASTLARWVSLPDRIWSIGGGLAGTLFDGGARRAAKAQAVAAYDQTVANYRQTVLGAFQEVEDNLAAQRLLEQEAVVQNDALRSAREALALVNNRYRAGTAGLLDVLTAQTSAYTAERTALSITGRQYTAAVVLIKALGGGWHAQPAGSSGSASPSVPAAAPATVGQR